MKKMKRRRDNEYEGNLKINCNVSTCAHNCVEDSTCLLKEIRVARIKADESGDADKDTALVTLAGKFGTILLSLIWFIAVAGVFMKIFWMGAPRWLSTMIYVIMGWLSITAFVPLMKTVGWGGFGMLLGGGIAYTVGAVIYALKKPNFAILKSFGFHEIFHVFSAFSTKILRASAAPTFCVQPQAQPHDFDPPVPVSGQEKRTAVPSSFVFS